MVDVMKRLFLTSLMVVAVAWPSRAVIDLVDGVAAIVNDKIITYSDMREYVQPVIAQLRRDNSGQELIDKVRSAQIDALNSLIDRALIIQEFNAKGYSIPHHVLEQQYKETIAEQFNNDRTAFLKTLEAQHLTVTQYREQLRDRVIVQAMRNRNIQQEIAVSPYKIEQYYQAHTNDYQVSDQIKLRMIFIKKSPAPPVAPPPAIDESTNATATAEPPAALPPADPQHDLASEILSKLDGKDSDAKVSFEELAKLYSQGKESKEGGEWGWVDREALRKELNEIAFTLKPGEHSRIIDTPEGYYILQVDDVKAAHVKPLAEVWQDIDKILLQQQRSAMQTKWMQELRAKAYIWPPELRGDIKSLASAAAPVNPQK